MTRQKKAEPGQYLTIRLGAQICAIQVTAVREINQVSEITDVPSTPDFVRGVINLRGKIIPVVDLKSKFGMPETTATRETCIVVIDCDHGHVGIVVDQVNEVVDIKENEIEPPPALGENELDYLMGLAKVKEKVLLLIDVVHSLSKEQFLKKFAVNLQKVAA